MFNSKMYKKYYPIKSSFDIANMNVAEQKKLIYWIKSLSEDIRLHNMNSLKKAMQYRENEYRVVEVNCTDDNIASLCNKISCNSDSITDNEISLINAVLYRHKYVKIIGMDVDGRLGCSFHWFDDESEDWNYSKNCDELCGM